MFIQILNMFNAARLKKLRKDFGLTQMEMSERLFIKQSSYSKYETNNADLDLSLLQKSKEQFNIDLLEFIYENNLDENKEVGNPTEEVNRNTSSIPKDNYYALIQENLNANLANQQILLQSQQAIIELIKVVINKFFYRIKTFCDL